MLGLETISFNQYQCLQQTSSSKTLQKVVQGWLQKTVPHINWYDMSCIQQDYL